MLRRIALSAAWRLKRPSFPLLAVAVLHSRRLLGLSALLVLGCADVLGDVAVGQGSAAPAIDGSAGTLVAAPPPLPVIPTAADSEALPAVPALDQSSSSPEREESAPPPPRVCEQGDFRCSGADVEFCLNGITWIPWQTCGSARLCQSEPAGRCIPALCAAGQQRCVDGSLQRCGEDLSDWIEVELCATAAHCDPRQEQCLGAPCEPGQERCNGDQLEACSDDQLGWEGRQQCASAALCQSDEQPGVAACLPPTCDEGTFRCAASGALQVCNTELTDFDNIAQCATAALCNAELGRCEAPACNPGQHACTPAGELLLCNEARNGFRAQRPAVICGETETCDAVRGVCEPLPLPPPPPPPPPPPVDEPEPQPPVVVDDDQDTGRGGADDDADDDDGRGSRDDDDRGGGDDDDRGGGDDDDRGGRDDDDRGGRDDDDDERDGRNDDDGDRRGRRSGD